MPSRIEDYALLGDTQTAALVGKDGSVDWLCLPRFDSGACFAALLGTPENGRFRLSPAGGLRKVERKYRPGTLVLETEFTTDDGVVAVVDTMPPRGQAPDLVRVVEGRGGRVPMELDLAIRFDYGAVVPWVRRVDGDLLAIAGPDALRIQHGVEVEARDFRHVAEFSVSAGDQVPFVVTWYPSYEEPPPRIDALAAVDDSDSWWRDWSDKLAYDGPWRDEVIRSLIVLKALTYAPTGGIIAAATTSLPEWLGGVRNWDYRLCWLRDATFTLYALHLASAFEEAESWRHWLLRAVAGNPDQMQIMYGPAGERRLPELELGWLPGYEGSRPVRVGNAASSQFQLDVYGEVMDALHLSRRAGQRDGDPAWALQLALLEFLESKWSEPDEGIWEVRGRRRHFTHSKVMAWVAFDRAVKAVDKFGLEGPVERWRDIRQRIHDEVCAKGFDPDRNTFVQSYGSRHLDASLLMVPLVGFLPPTDARVRGTVEAIERELMADGFVLRYPREAADEIDGLPPGEGAFLACSFWLVDNLAVLGRRKDALALFERLIGLTNDVGLLSEEYDTESGRLLGNFPQALSHVALINSAHNLGHGLGPAEDRFAE